VGRYELVSHIDAVPTLLGLANAAEYLRELPADAFDGRDFSARLRAGPGALTHWKTETILEYSSLKTDGDAVQKCDEEHGKGGHIKSTRNNTWIALRVVPANTSSGSSSQKTAGLAGQHQEEADPTVGNWLYVC
jgi:hypothetical protein